MGFERDVLPVRSRLRCRRLSLRHRTSHVDSDDAKVTEPLAADEADSDSGAECDSSLDVLARAREGDTEAARVLIERTVGPLRRWARGRLPNYARAGANTEDVVQDAVVRALARVEHFEHRSVDGMQKYLRESVRNRIRDEVRRVARRGVGEELPEAIHDNAYSPLEELIMKERSERYLEALRSLKPADRQAIILRLEHRHSFEDIARALGKASPDAARMTVSRAVKRLAAAIGLDGPATP